MPRKDREKYNARQKEQRRRRQVLANSDMDYHGLLSRQGGGCAICHAVPEGRQHHIDHDHESGMIRGLLCGPCNMALGLFKDDVGRLEAAIHYLNQSRKSPQLAIPDPLQAP